ncbi:MAG TPA: pyroglutamyl-peptidase I [Candidatus Methylomirabilis sp.]|nr:pyroglutamyl-peptidase I [Candidatus Methylomirabilis sp.]
MPDEPRARHLLVTGFEPFDNDTVNPSGEVAKLLDGTSLGTCSVRSLILPVQHEAARERVAAALDAPGLAAVVHLGLAGGRARISLERVALNVMDYAIPDATGQVFVDTPCSPGGPVAHLSTLPLRGILRELTAQGIPAHISNTAGTYLCNYTLYTTLDELARRDRAIPAGFIHLPFLPSMVVAHASEEASMDLPLMTRAVDIALRCAIADAR